MQCYLRDFRAPIIRSFALSLATISLVALTPLAQAVDHEGKAEAKKKNSRPAPAGMTAADALKVLEKNYSRAMDDLKLWKDSYEALKATGKVFAEVDGEKKMYPQDPRAQEDSATLEDLMTMLNREYELLTLVGPVPLDKDGTRDIGSEGALLNRLASGITFRTTTLPGLRNEVDKIDPNGKSHKVFQNVLEQTKHLKTLLPMIEFATYLNTLLIDVDLEHGRKPGYYREVTRAAFAEMGQQRGNLRNHASIVSGWLDKGKKLASTSEPIQKVIDTRLGTGKNAERVLAEDEASESK